MFDKLNLSEEVLKALETKGFTIPTEIQNSTIPLIVEGKDIVGRSKTGSGKTFAFGLPAIDKIDVQLKAIQVLVVCPTRELALQVTDEIRKISEYKQGCKVVPIYGGADISRQISAIKNSKIVVGTPGRIMDHIDRRTLRLDKIKMVVLDEADEMLNMGFKEDIETILKTVPKIRQTVMFSATMPPQIKAITKEFMIKPEYIEIGGLNTTLDEIEQTYIKTLRNGKKNALVELFSKLNPNSAIVFCNTKKMVDEIKGILNNEGVKAVALHGDMRQSERKRVMSAVKSHDAKVLIATDVAARGIDIDSVEYIINFDLPNDIEYYIHRIGRTGRAGKSGKSITLINTKEQYAKLMEYKTESKSKILENDLSSSLSSYGELKTDSSTKAKTSRQGNRSLSYRTSTNSTFQAPRENRPRTSKSYSSNDKARTQRSNSDDATKSDSIKKEYKDYRKKDSADSRDVRSFRSKDSADSRDSRSFRSKDSADSRDGRSFRSKDSGDSRDGRSFRSKDSADSRDGRSFRSKDSADSRDGRSFRSKDSADSRDGRSFRSKDSADSRDGRSFRSKDSANSRDGRNFRSKDSAGSRDSRSFRSKDSADSRGPKSYAKKEYGSYSKPKTSNRSKDSVSDDGSRSYQDNELNKPTNTRTRTSNYNGKRTAFNPDATGIKRNSYSSKPTGSRRSPK